MNPLGRRSGFLHNAKSAVVMVQAVVMMVQRKGNTEKKAEKKRTENLQGKIFMNGANNGIRTTESHRALNYVMGNQVFK